MINRLLLLLGLFLVTSGLINAQDDIDRLILNRNYSEALVQLNNRLDETPVAELYFKQGLVFEKLMDYDSAIKSFVKACEADPEVSLYWEELAEANSGLGNYINATGYLQQAIQLDSTNLVLKGKLAQTYINLKAYADAFRCYKQIWETDSTNTYYNRYFAYAAYRSGNEKLAAKLYEQLADQKSRDLNTYLNLATIYNKNEDSDGSISACDRGLLIFPQHPAFLLKKADTYFLFKNYQEAIEPYEEYLAVSDSTLDVLKNYGICLYFGKDEERALAMLDKCYRVNVNDPIVNFYMGACYKKLKHFDESVGFFNLAIETATPAYLAEIYHHLGQVYGLLREFEASVGAYQKALELDATKVELLFEIATTYEEFNGNKTIALHYYREYLKEAGETAQNADFALDRLKKIKEELFFDEGN